MYITKLKFNLYSYKKYKANLEFLTFLTMQLEKKHNQIYLDFFVYRHLEIFIIVLGSNL